MTVADIDNAIEVLEVCQGAWSNTIEYDGQVISDYEAIEQAIKCLKEYKEAKIDLSKV